MKIYEEIAEVAETDSVYVKLYNNVHTCESLRGAQSEDGAFTSEYYGGDFEDAEIRKQIQQK
jgi:GTP cyclohydrolase I